MDSCFIHKYWLFPSYTKDTGDGRSRHPLKRTLSSLLMKLFPCLPSLELGRGLQGALLRQKCQNNPQAILAALILRFPTWKFPWTLALWGGGKAVGMMGRSPGTGTSRRLCQCILTGASPGRPCISAIHTQPRCLPEEGS